MFTVYTGDDLQGLFVNDNHVVFRWLDDDCKILFSAAQRGDALTCHFSSDKAGLRKLQLSFADFIRFVNNEFPWCQMLIAAVEKPSVMRLLLKTNFETVYSRDNKWIMARRI